MLFYNAYLSNIQGTQNSTFSNLAPHRERDIDLQMAKLDPIVSEFESDEAAEAYDVWFRAQVEAALAETGPGIDRKSVV